MWRLWIFKCLLILSTNREQIGNICLVCGDLDYMTFDKTSFGKVNVATRQEFRKSGIECRHVFHVVIFVGCDVVTSFLEQHFSNDFQERGTSACVRANTPAYVWCLRAYACALHVSAFVGSQRGWPCQPPPSPGVELTYSPGGLRRRDMSKSSRQIGRCQRDRLSGRAGILWRVGITRWTGQGCNPDT